MKFNFTFGNRKDGLEKIEVDADTPEDIEKLFQQFWKGEGMQIKEQKPSATKVRALGWTVEHGVRDNSRIRTARPIPSLWPDPRASQQPVYPDPRVNYCEQVEQQCSLDSSKIFKEHGTQLTVEQELRNFLSFPSENERDGIFPIIQLDKLIVSEPYTELTKAGVGHSVTPRTPPSFLFPHYFRQLTGTVGNWTLFRLQQYWIALPKWPVGYLNMWIDDFKSCALVFKTQAQLSTWAERIVRDTVEAEETPKPGPLISAFLNPDTTFTSDVKVPFSERFSQLPVYHQGPIFVKTVGATLIHELAQCRIPISALTDDMLASFFPKEILHNLVKGGVCGVIGDWLFIRAANGWISIKRPDTKEGPYSVSEVPVFGTLHITPKSLEATVAKIIHKLNTPPPVSKPPYCTRESRGLFTSFQSNSSTVEGRNKRLIVELRQAGLKANTEGIDNISLPKLVAQGFIKTQVYSQIKGFYILRKMNGWLVVPSSWDGLKKISKSEIATQCKFFDTPVAFKQFVDETVKKVAKKLAKQFANVVKM